MVALAALLACPLLMVAASVLTAQSRALSRLSAGLMWLQMAAAAAVCAPALGYPGVASALPQGFRMDGIAALYILLTTLVVTAATTHAVGFFQRDEESGHPVGARPVRQFYCFTALFLVAMYAVVAADNLGYLWISVEATTLASAPLVYYHRTRTSLEATWKYFLVCSVGIAFAFLGTAILYAASQRVAVIHNGTLSIATLTDHARLLPRGLVRLGFVFTLLGYGTKAGLFPLHNWLPDAHSEAPAPASAMLSGALLNVALVALLRTSGIMNAAGDSLFVRTTLLPMAVLTVLFAGLFLLKQRDIKRMLAYSSMENVGLMAVAIALGNTAGFGLQAINHTLVKVALFLMAGNLLQQYGTQEMRKIRGVLAASPAQGALLLAAAVAIAGSPPFGSFLAEWNILAGAADTRHIATVVLLCLALAVAFIALMLKVVGITLGALPADAKPPVDGGSTLSRLAVPAVLLVLSLAMGLMLSPRVMALAGGISR